MAERSARRRKSSKSVEQLKAEISARDEAKANRAAERKPSGAAAEAQEAARRRRNAETYEKEKAARAKKGSSGYGYSQHLMGGSSRSSSFNPRSVREEVLVDYLLDEGFASDEKSAQAIANVMSEEWVLDVLDEVTGGGHISPHGTSYTGQTSASQKKYNKFRDQYSGGDTQTTRDKVGIRSKYSRDSREELPSRNSRGTARSPEGTPSGLAMSPDRRMETRAKSLRARGQGKRANKIDAVRNRPNMSESWIEGIVEGDYSG